MTKKTPIILVHGAWSNASTWDQVVGYLQADGHDVRAIDLPGHGADAARPQDVGLADYAKRLAGVLQDVGPALLVGHSMGGMAVSAGAELAPDMVRKLVFVTGFLPRNGQSLLDLIKTQAEPGLRAAIVPGAQPGATVLDPEIAADILYQDASAKQRRAALAGFGPQPDRGQTEAAVLSDAGFGRIPRSYIHCLQDRTISLGLQRKMVSDSPCEQVFSLDCGHVPQLTRPRELAAMLSQL